MPEVDVLPVDWHVETPVNMLNERTVFRATETNGISLQHLHQGNKLTDPMQIYATVEIWDRGGSPGFADTNESLLGAEAHGPWTTDPYFNGGLTTKRIEMVGQEVKNVEQNFWRELQCHAFTLRSCHQHFWR